MRHIAHTKKTSAADFSAALAFILIQIDSYFFPNLAFIAAVSAS